MKIDKRPKCKSNKDREYFVYVDACEKRKKYTIDI